MSMALFEVWCIPFRSAGSTVQQEAWHVPLLSFSQHGTGCSTLRCSDAGDRHMTARRTALLITCLAVAGLGVVFAVVQWELSSRLATLVSALAATAAVGIAIWAALPGATTTVRVTNTGPATSGKRGTANSGLTGPTSGLTGGVEVHHTGAADASAGGEANTGGRLR